MRQALGFCLLLRGLGLGGAEHPQLMPRLPVAAKLPVAVDRQPRSGRQGARGRQGQSVGARIPWLEPLPYALEHLF